MPDKISLNDLLAEAKQDAEDVKELDKAISSLKGLQDAVKKAKSEVGKNEKEFAEAEDEE